MKIEVGVEDPQVHAFLTRVGELANELELSPVQFIGALETFKSAYILALYEETAPD